EYRFGVHRGAGSLLAVFVGTGVGSGVVLDGQLWCGAGNAAGELGHTQVVADGRPCPCGARGCLEQYVSGSGFQRRLRDALAADVKTRLAELTENDPDALDATMVAAAANSGDEFARELWTDATRYLTQAVANYVTLLNPQILILGGGLFEALPELFDGVAGGILKAPAEPALDLARGWTRRASPQQHFDCGGKAAARTALRVYCTAAMRDRADRWDYLFAGALGILTVLSRLPYRARMLYNWDGVQFAL